MVSSKGRKQRKANLSFRVKPQEWDAVVDQMRNARAHGGFRLKWFMYNDKTEEEIHLDGQFLNVSQVFEKVKFESASNKETKKLIEVRSFISQNFKSEKVIRLRDMITLDTGEYLCGYEPFDGSFKDSNKDMMTDEWWIIESREILDAFSLMHEMNFFHGNTSSEDSYKIKDGKIVLMCPSIDGSRNFDSENMNLGKDDVDGFIQFLKDNVGRELAPREDWISFISYSKQEARRMRKHPLLLSSSEKFQFWRQAIDWYNNNVSDKHSRTRFHTLISKEHHGWNNKIRNKLLNIWNYQRVNAQYYEEQGHRVIELVEMVMDHIHHHEKNLQPQDKTSAEELVQIISEEFPSFLSLIHEALTSHVPHEQLTCY